MQRFLSRLSSGFLVDFEERLATTPKTSSRKAKYLSAFWLGFSFLILISCSSAKHATQIVHDYQRDTIYLSNTRYDSIYVNSAHDMDYHPSKDYIYLLDSILILKVDTMYIHDKQLEYKYKYLHDTTYVHKVDSIPVIKTVEVTKTERYVPSIYKWSLGICISLIVLLVLFVLRKLKLLNL